MDYEKEAAAEAQRRKDAAAAAKRHEEAERERNHIEEEKRQRVEAEKRTEAERQQRRELLEIQEVESLIEAIGTVSITPECLDRINNAFNAYRNLSDDQKRRVSNLSTLSDAAKKYNALKKETDDNQRAARKVIDLINSIGTVEFTEACRSRISSARLAYSNLSVAQRTLVTNYSRLLQADSDYRALENEANESLERRIRRVNFSLTVNIIIAIFAIAVMLITKFNVDDFRWYLLLNALSAVPGLVYGFIAALMYDDQHGGWTIYDTLVFVFMGTLYAAVLLACFVFKVYVLSTKVLVIGFPIEIIAVLIVTTIRCLNFLNENNRNGNRTRAYRVLSCATYIALAILLTASTIKDVKNLNTLNVGDSVEFGSYEIDGNLDNGSEALSWTVHEVKKGQALLLCDTCIEAMAYNAEGTDNSWTNSDIRAWLNEVFYEEDFSAEEKTIITEQEIVTERLSDEEGHTLSATTGESEVTIDRVFIPSMSEFWMLNEEIKVSSVAENKTYNLKNIFWSRAPYGLYSNYAHGYDVDTKRDVFYVLPPDLKALVRPAVYINVESFSDHYRSSQSAGSEIQAKLSLTARLKGTKDWGEVVRANIGDEVEYQIEFVNLTENTLNDIMIRDVLPTNVEYINGSTYLYNSSYQEGIQLGDDSITTDGINIGSYASKGSAYVRFSVKIIDVDLADGSNQLVNWANVTLWDLDGIVYKDDVSILVD